MQRVHVDYDYAAPNLIQLAFQASDDLAHDHLGKWVEKIEYEVSIGKLEIGRILVAYGYIRTCNIRSRFQSISLDVYFRDLYDIRIYFDSRNPSKGET